MMYTYSILSILGGKRWALLSMLKYIQLQLDDLSSDFNNSVRKEGKLPLIDDGGVKKK